MNKEFIPYDEALELKELGFDEPCFGYYISLGDNKETPFKLIQIQSEKEQFKWIDNGCHAPLYQQAFRWFRKRYNLHQHITQYYGQRFYFKIEDMVHPQRYDIYPIELLRSFNESASQEEAELQCLRKLIEIVKNK
jgi:hypothetical protein